MHRESATMRLFTIPALSYGTRMALYTYLIDTSQGGLGPNIVQPDKVLAAGGYWVRIRISRLQVALLK